MHNNPQQKDDRTSKKSRRNKLDYLARKKRDHHVLLRLGNGSHKQLDAACESAGLSRSAFATLYLPPILAALAIRFAEIDRVRIFRAQTLTSFFGLAIDQYLSLDQSLPAPLVAADEFDALFPTENS